MKKWIRWQGLIAFIAVTTAMLIIGILLMDPLIKCAIESKGSELAGARVELASADLSLFPLGLTLAGLQVADKDAPMTNMVEVERIAFLMDSGALLMRKVEIKDMAIEGMAFGTARKTPGALPSAGKKAEEAKETAPSKPLITFETPDAADVLKNEELETLKAAKQLEDLLAEKEGIWKKRTAELPEQKNVKAYEDRLKEALAGKLTPESAKERAKKLSSLSDDISKDTGLIKGAEKDLKADIKALREKLAEAKAAPKNDKDRLASKYSLSPEGIERMSSMLFGGRLMEWSGRALKYYTLAKPYIAQYESKKKTEVKHERGKGVDVRFKERNPRPDFIIQRATASVKLDSGIVKGEAMDLSAEQHITGKPSTFEFKSDALDGMRSMNLKGTLDHVQPAKSADRIIFNTSGLDLSGVSLSGGSMPVKLAGASAGIKAEGVVRTGDVIEATASMNFNSVTIETGGSGAVASAIASALRDVKSFTLNARLTGTLEDHDISISSDLDAALKQAAGKAVAEETRKFREKLDAEIKGRTDGRLKELESKVAGFGGIEDKLNSSRESLESVQKKSTSSGKDQAGDAIKQKLKKLF